LGFSWPELRAGAIRIALNGCVVPNWRLEVAPSLASDIQVNGFLGVLDQILDGSDS
jgi:hypothetical protein